MSNSDFSLTDLFFLDLGGRPVFFHVLWIQQRTWDVKGLPLELLNWTVVATCHHKWMVILSAFRPCLLPVFEFWFLLVSEDSNCRCMPSVVILFSGSLNLFVFLMFFFLSNDNHGAVLQWNEARKIPKRGTGGRKDSRREGMIVNKVSFPPGLPTFVKCHNNSEKCEFVGGLLFKKWFKREIQGHVRDDFINTCLCFEGVGEVGPLQWSRNGNSDFWGMVRCIL